MSSPADGGDAPPSGGRTVPSDRVVEPSRPRRWPILLVAPLLGILLVVVVARWAGLGLDALVASVVQAEPLWLLALALLTALHFLITSRKWVLTTRILDSRQRYGTRFFRYTALVGVLAQVLPLQVCTVAVRSLALKLHDRVPVRTSAGTAVFDQGLDLLVVLLALGPAVLVLLGVVGPVAGVVLTAALLLGAGLVLVRFGTRLPALLRRLAGLHRRTRDLFDRHEGSLRAFTEPAALGRLHALSCLRYANLVLRYAVVALAIGSPVSFDDVLWVSPVVMLSFVLTVTPTGLGLAEAGWVALLGVLGHPAAEAARFAIAARILVAAAALGVNLVLVVPVWGRRRRDPSAPAEAPGRAHVSSVVRS